MAKYVQKLRAIELRKEGISVGTIAMRVGVSKGTASEWTSDIILSIEQLEKLRKQSLFGAERGRVIASLNKKRRRTERVENEKSEGEKLFFTLTKRELLIAGLTLYSGEGVKKRREVRFCNSDPKIIVFMLRWLKECFAIETVGLHCAVGINETHKDREEKVKKYWSRITRIPLSNFRQTSFKKVQARKLYENFNDHYGTLDVRVLRSTRLFYKIMGEIHGLFNFKTLKG